ncbi:MAG: M48 family peptidase [Saprospirales bacterium]|nr:MAG: M48 family peptidase [Saprospirales bacterium]
MSSSTYVYLDINECKIPARLVYEARKNVYFSLASKNFILRFPTRMSPFKRAEFLEQGKAWVAKVIDENPGLLSRFSEKTYVNGQSLRCFDRDYTISLSTPDHRHFQVNLVSGLIKIPAEREGLDKVSGEIVSKTLQKLFARVYRPIIFLKGMELASKAGLPGDFDLSLRYMTTKWGSCSKTKGKLSINTRLILAPEKVLDAVILHELCHLVHANHSHQFWSLLEKVDPDYKIHTKWLKTNGPLLKL